jgi:hypothetical protein
LNHDAQEVNDSIRSLEIHRDFADSSRPHH